MIFSSQLAFANPKEDKEVFKQIVRDFFSAYKVERNQVNAGNLSALFDILFRFSEERKHSLSERAKAFLVNPKELDENEKRVYFRYFQKILLRHQTYIPFEIGNEEQIATHTAVVDTPGMIPAATGQPNPATEAQPNLAPETQPIPVEAQPDLVPQAELNVLMPPDIPIVPAWNEIPNWLNRYESTIYHGLPRNGRRLLDHARALIAKLPDNHLARKHPEFLLVAAISAARNINGVCTFCSRLGHIPLGYCVPRPMEDGSGYILLERCWRITY